MSNQADRYHVNQYVTINGMKCMIEGYNTDTDLVIRVKLPLDKPNEKYFSQFECLNIRASLSRLYIIPVKIVRQSDEYKSRRE